MSVEAPSPETSDAPKQEDLLVLTSDVVAAYVSNNSISTNELPELIQSVDGKLSSLGAAAEPEVKQDPAVPIKRSVRKDAITCLECGKDQKMLKRHLASAHGLTPEEYRAKWHLPHDYPIVAPDYAEKRRSLAKEIGLGRKPTAAKKAPAKGKAARPKKS